ncbi:MULTISPECIES: hypothetical protein [Streptomyces]|uniref:hypothetical protein n=1 Tax=Streptomyces herbicida TaxID=3065675 RepID=UPI00293032CA|nr:hypothetical protein [Streptomyces sp. NEAU-HV9]
MNRETLGIYLNDHLAGATTGQLMSRHLAEHHRFSPYGDQLQHVADEIAEDRQTLLAFLEALGIPARRHKVYAGWLAEKARLLKFNGRVMRRSGLSTVIELETLRLGIEGKILLWQTLLELAPTKELDDAQLRALLERARRQSETVGSVRRRAAVGAFHRPQRRTSARLLSATRESTES